MPSDPPLRLGGAVIDPPVLLAPMEGITDPLFRDLVCPLGGLGGACSEFVRITSGALSARTLVRALGPGGHGVPTAVQLMAPGPEHVAGSAAAAASAGAAWIDLNFGCPAPGVVAHCAGSALLADPGRIAAIILAARVGTRLAVTAKVRAGIADADALERIVLTCADAGASAITLHARLRRQGYHEPAHWPWIARARACLDRGGHAGVPLIGNGSIDAPADITRMRAETGCQAVMVGRAALADPFLFRTAAGAAPAGAAEAMAFARAYARALLAARGAAAALPRVKQLVRWLRAGGVLDDEGLRARLMRADGSGLAAWLGLDEGWTAPQPSVQT